jgi:hypothetical protein
VAAAEAEDDGNEDVVELPDDLGEQRLFKERLRLEASGAST